MTKGVDKRIDESVIRWIRHVERIENDKIAESVYVGKCGGSCSVGRLIKTWIDTVKDCLKEKGLEIRKAREWCIIGAYGGGL